MSRLVTGWRTPLNARKLAALSIVAITLFGFGLRLWKLDWEPLHVDEIRQAWEMQQPWGEILPLANENVGAPFDYVIGRALVTVAPATDFTQRLPSAVFGTASVALVGLLLFRERKWLGAVLAALFVAVSPLSVAMSQNMRPYASAVALVLATLAVYQHWQLGSRGRSTAIWFMVVSALALLTRPIMPVVALATFGVVVLLKRTDEIPLTRPVRLLKSDPLALVALPAVFLITWIPSSLDASSGYLVECWSCDKWGRVASGVQKFGEYGEIGIRPLSLASLILVGVVALGLPSVRNALRSTSLTWAPILLTAPLFTMVYVVAIQPGLLPAFAIRYLVFLPVGIALFYAIAIDAIVGSVGDSARLARIATVVAVFGILVWAVTSMLAWTRWQSENQDLADWKSVSNYIESVEATGDVIVSIDARPLSRGTPFAFMGAPRYYHGSLRYVTPERAVDHPEWAIDATRYHFVIFVPKMASGWSVPEGWDFAEFSEMMVFSTSPLDDHAARMEAWWVMTLQLRPDVAVRTQIGAVALETLAGSALHPWADAARQQAATMGLLEFAEGLLAEAGGG